MSNQNNDGGGGSNGSPKPPDMPSRVLTMDPTRRDAGVGVLTLVIKYDPLQHDVQIQGPRGMDIVGLIGILELAQAAVIAQASKRK